MTTVTGDLRNVLGEKAQGTVRWQSVGVRPGVTFSGEVIDDWQSAPVKDGRFSVSVEPGPARIRVVSGTTNWSAEVEVPNSGSVTLAKLIEGQTKYSPRILSEVEKFVRDASSASARASASADRASDAERAARGEADRAQGAVAAVEEHAARAEGAASTVDSVMKDAAAALEKEANGAVTRAGNFASLAEGYAGKAAASEKAAEGHASAAKKASGESVASAEKAGKSASEAAEIMQTVTGAMQITRSAESNAKQSEEAAGASAVAAKGHADRAVEASGSVDAVVSDAAGVLEERLRDSASSAQEFSEAAKRSAEEAASAAKAEVDRLKGDAPEAFDTLGEIAAELAKNESDRSALANSIAAKADKDHKHRVHDITGLPRISSAKDGETIARRLMGGQIMVANPTSLDHAATKQYVDGATTDLLVALQEHPRQEYVDERDKAILAEAKSNTRKEIEDLYREVVASLNWLASRPAFFSGKGAPPSEIKHAAVGDFYFNETTKELHKITEV